MSGYYRQRNCKFEGRGGKKGKNKKKDTQLVDSMLTLRNFEPRQWPSISCKYITRSTVKIVPLPVSVAPLLALESQSLCHAPACSAAVPCRAALLQHRLHCGGTGEGLVKGASSGQTRIGLQSRTPHKAAHKSLSTSGRGEKTSQGSGVMVCFDVRCCKDQWSMGVAVYAHFRVILTAIGICLSNVNLIQN